MLSSRSTLLSGAVTGGLAVAFGAFGAHALRPVLAEHQGTEIYNLAAQYQFYHALSLLIIGMIMQKGGKSALAGWAGFCMLTGILLFSGSLYAMALTGTHAVVFITPLGGLFFLTGWTLLIIHLLK